MSYQERAYLLRGLKPEHRKLVAQIPSGPSLSVEIAFVRSRVRKLAETYELLPADELDDANCQQKLDELERQRKIDRQLIRMLELLTRMVNVQSRMADDTADPVTEAADQVRQGLQKAGLPSGRTPKERSPKSSGEPDADQT